MQVCGHPLERHLTSRVTSTRRVTLRQVDMSTTSSNDQSFRVARRNVGSGRSLLLMFASRHPRTRCCWVTSEPLVNADTHDCSLNGASLFFVRAQLLCVKACHVEQLRHALIAF